MDLKASNLVDLFVDKVNASDKEAIYCPESSTSIFVGDPDDCGFCQWEIKPISITSSTEALEQKLGMSFPESYRSFINRYVFPSFVCNGVLLFGNTVDCKDIYELRSRLFSDPVLSKVLISNGFIQFGIPASGIYDPICFDTNIKKRMEFPVVQLDHEAILQHETIKVVRHLADSFLDLISN